MSDRTAGELDRAILAWRESLSDADKARLEAAARAHVDDFYAEQAEEFVDRTTRF
jgi:membrane protein required for beta-lactamase induction